MITFLFLSIAVVFLLGLLLFILQMDINRQIQLELLDLNHRLRALQLRRDETTNGKRPREMKL